MKQIETKEWNRKRSSIFLFVSSFSVPFLFCFIFHLMHKNYAYNSFFEVISPTRQALKKISSWSPKKTTIDFQIALTTVPKVNFGQSQLIRIPGVLHNSLHDEFCAQLNTPRRTPRRLEDKAGLWCVPTSFCLMMNLRDVIAVCSVKQLRLMIPDTSSVCSAVRIFPPRMRSRRLFAVWWENAGFLLFGE